MNVLKFLSVVWLFEEVVKIFGEILSDDEKAALRDGMKV